MFFIIANYVGQFIILNRNLNNKSINIDEIIYDVETGLYRGHFITQEELDKKV